MMTGILEGLVNGTEQVVFDREVTGSAVSSIDTGNILNGDEDGWYTIIHMLVGGNNGAYTKINFNGDTGNNYGRKGISASSTTVVDASGTGDPGWYPGYVATAGHSAFNIIKLYAKSGSVRLGNIITVDQITGTTVGRIIPAGVVWNNTADNLVSVQLIGVAANDIGIGSRLIILKSNNFTNGTPTGVINTPYIKGAWVRVGSQILGSAANTVTFSGLDGDTAILYYLSCSIKATGNLYPRLRINSDTNANYGNQVLSANNTTIRCARNSNDGLYLQDYVVSASGEHHHSNTLIFSKQGFIRPIVYESAGKISGTTVSELEFGGASYNVTNTNITSINIFGYANFDTGSQFDLYALYK